jgi:CheY-like chemotaxis protein
MNDQPLKEFSILYLEDDLASRKVMSIILERAAGIKTFAVFENSADFMARLKSLAFKPTIFLIDIHVPPHDGFEVLHMLRNDPEHHSAIIIALTASVMIEEVRQLRAAGFDGAISKPIDHRKFPSLLNRIAAGESVWNIS